MYLQKRRSLAPGGNILMVNIKFDIQCLESTWMRERSNTQNALCCSQIKTAFSKFKGEVCKILSYGNSESLNTVTT